MLKKDKFAKMCKEKMVDELSDLFEKHPNFILTSYMGTSVAGLETVRKNLRPVKSRYIVVKNSILNVVLDKQKLENFKELLEMKKQQGLTISLALPALNEEQTVGTVIRMMKKELMEKIPLLDEIVLLDSNSTDRTREIAEQEGVPVYIHQQLLERLGARTGKGEA